MSPSALIVTLCPLLVRGQQGKGYNIAIGPNVSCIQGGMKGISLLGLMLAKLQLHSLYSERCVLDFDNLARFPEQTN